MTHTKLMLKDLITYKVVVNGNVFDSEVKNWIGR